jgi:hypothetical protein
MEKGSQKNSAYIRLINYFLSLEMEMHCCEAASFYNVSYFTKVMRLLSAWRFTILSAIQP